MSKYLHRLGAQKQKFELEATIHYLKLSRQSQCLVKLRAKRGKDKTEETPSLSYSPLLKQLQFNHILSFVITMYKKGSKYSKKDLNISLIEIIGKTEKKIGSLTIEFHTIAETGKSIEFKEFILKDSKDSAKICISIKLFLQQEIVKSGSSSRSDSLNNVRRAFSVDENDSLKLRDEMLSMEEDKEDKYKVKEEKKDLGNSSAAMKRKVSEKSLRSAFVDGSKDNEKTSQGLKGKGTERVEAPLIRGKVQSASVKGSMKKNFHFESFNDIEDLLDEDNDKMMDVGAGAGAGFGRQGARGVGNKEDELDEKGSDSSSDDYGKIDKKSGENELEKEKIDLEEIEANAKNSDKVLALSMLSRSSSSDSSKSEKSQSKIKSNSSKKSQSSSSSKSSSPRIIPLATSQAEVQVQILSKVDYSIITKPSTPYLQLTLSKAIKKPSTAYLDLTHFRPVIKPIPSFLQLNHMTQSSKPIPAFLELNHFKQVTKPVAPSMQLNLLCQVIKPASSFLQLNTWTQTKKPKTSLIQLNLYTQKFSAIKPVKVDIFSIIEEIDEKNLKDLKESSDEDKNKSEFDSDKSDISSASSNDELKVPEPIFKDKYIENYGEKGGSSESSDRNDEESDSFSEGSSRSSGSKDEIILENGKNYKLSNQYSSVITDSTITFVQGEEFQVTSKNNVGSCVDDERQEGSEKGFGEICVPVGEISIENRSRSSSSSSSRSSNSSKSSSKPKHSKIDSSPTPPNPSKSEESDTNIFDRDYIVSSSSESHSSETPHSPKSPQSESFSGPQSDMKSIVPNSSSQEDRLNLKEKESGLPESRNTTCCGKCSIF